MELKLELKRYKIGSDYIDGQLFVNGRKLCDTVENMAMSLPGGTYPVVMHHCKLRGYDVPVVLTRGFKTRPRCSRCRIIELAGYNTALPCVCTQICPGNGMSGRRDSAIIVGTCRASGCLVFPERAFAQVCGIVRRIISGGGRVTIRITDMFEL